MSPQPYQLIHVISAILLVGFTFKAFAAPMPENKGKTMAITGVLALGVALGGFGLMAKLGFSYTSGWVILKIVAWLGLAALSGIVFRKPKLAGLFTMIGVLLVGMAVYSVYVKPF